MILGFNDQAFQQWFNGMPVALHGLILNRLHRFTINLYLVLAVKLGESRLRKAMVCLLRFMG